jgi:hypothetical protein
MESLNEIEKVLVAHTTLWCFVLFLSVSDSSEIKPKVIHLLNNAGNTSQVKLLNWIFFLK